MTDLGARLLHNWLYAERLEQEVFGRVESRYRGKIYERPEYTWECSALRCHEKDVRLLPSGIWCYHCYTTLPRCSRCDEPATGFAIYTGHKKLSRKGKRLWIAECRDHYFAMITPEDIEQIMVSERNRRFFDPFRRCA